MLIKKYVNYLLVRLLILNVAKTNDDKEIDSSCVEIVQNIKELFDNTSYQNTICHKKNFLKLSNKTIEIQGK